MNRTFRFLFGSLVVAACAALAPASADACAVFVEPGELPPVLGHTMILSLGTDQTTLWDQFSYAGTPESFGWILPTKGTVSVGVSSDALFGAVGALTAPEIYEPGLGCPNSCDGNGGGGGGFGNPDKGVVILSQEVVGPFETVQISASDPGALAAWLSSHNYPVPPGVQPTLDAYVNEGFNFLAVKLVPGVGTEAIKPIRVTFDGAMPTFPLRLLVAGTSDKTDVTLFVVGDGVWVPKDAPTVTIQSSELTWDYSADKSDYEAVRTAKLASTNGIGYLLESARSVSKFDLDKPLMEFVQNDPDKGGYGDDPVKTAEQLLEEDLAAFHAHSGESGWVTRIVGTLSQAAFQKDLQLEAGDPELVIESSFTPGKTANVPECPPDPCAGEGGEGGDGGDDDGGCAVLAKPRSDDGLSVFAMLGAFGLSGLWAARRRKQTVRTSKK